MKDKIIMKLNGDWFRQSDLYALNNSKLIELLEALSAKQIEDIADIKLRDYSGHGDNEYDKLYEFVQHLNHILRPFAFATQDDSIAECEKLFLSCIETSYFKGDLLRIKFCQKSFERIVIIGTTRINYEHNPTRTRVNGEGYKASSQQILRVGPPCRQ